jgi:hypothetical protein
MRTRASLLWRMRTLPRCYRRGAAVALSWQIFSKPIASLFVRSRPSSANVQSGCQPLPQAATPISHKVERLHAYPRAVCKRVLLPTCCSDTPPTLFANRRWAAKFMVIQVRSCQVQRPADAVPHASCSLRRASSSPRRPVKQCRISPATAGKMTTHPTMLAVCNSLAARGCADVSEAVRIRDLAPSRGR